MNPVAIAGIVFGCVFCGAVIGMFLGVVLPAHHLSADSRDVIKLATGVIATLAALVLGLLIASEKSSFDTRENEFRTSAANLILLDHLLSQYGPETKEYRHLLRRAMEIRLHRYWPEESPQAPTLQPGETLIGFDDISDRLRELSPKNDGQRWLQSRALEINHELASTRWLLREQAGAGGSLTWPFTVVLVFWLTAIFLSIGLFAPRNATVIAVLFICALSVSGAIYLILQMGQPFHGLMKISGAPLRLAIEQIDR